MDNLNESAWNSRYCKAVALALGPRFGDEQTADVVLHLKRSCPPCGEDDALRINPASNGMVVSPRYLHSEALRRSEFFEAQLSERWSSSGELDCSSAGGKSEKSSSRTILELTYDNYKNPQSYVRCLRLLYVPNMVKHTCFTGVEDALNVLEVAAELLSHDCIMACLRYLESAPWSAEQEIALRASVSNLQLKGSEDLVARLSPTESITNDIKPLVLMHGVLGELLTRVTDGAPSNLRDVCERVLQGNIQPPLSPAFTLVNEVALFRERSKNLEKLKRLLNDNETYELQISAVCSVIEWIFDDLFKFQVADHAVTMFSEEKELAHLMLTKASRASLTHTLFQFLPRIIQALQNGDVLSTRSVRLTLLTTWLPAIAKFGSENSKVRDLVGKSMEDGLNAIVQSLPICDQESIFRIWIAKILRKLPWPDLSEAFECWCTKVRQAYRETNAERLTEIRKALLGVPE